MQHYNTPTLAWGIRLCYTEAIVIEKEFVMRPYAIFSNVTESITVATKTGVFNAYRLKEINHNGYEYDLTDSKYYYVPALNNMVTLNVGIHSKIISRQKKTPTYNMNVRSKLDERTYVKKVNARIVDLHESARKQIKG